MKRLSRCPQCGEHEAVVLYSLESSIVTLECPVCNFIGEDDKFHPDGPQELSFFDQFAGLDLDRRERLELVGVAAVLGLCKLVLLTIAGAAAFVGGGAWTLAKGLFSGPKPSGQVGEW